MNVKKVPDYSNDATKIKCPEASLSKKSTRHDRKKTQRDKKQSYVKKNS